MDPLVEIVGGSNRSQSPREYVAGCNTLQRERSERCNIRPVRTCPLHAAVATTAAAAAAAAAAATTTAATEGAAAAATVQHFVFTAV